MLKESDFQQRIPVLDGIRALAMAMILICHLSMGNYFPKGLSKIDALFYTFTSSGRYGVDLFFVLSGFLISGVLLDSRAEQGYFRRFYWRRLLRIFPLYYSFLFFLFFLAKFFPFVEFTNSPEYRYLAKNQIWLWTCLVNYFVAFKGEYLPLGMSYLWFISVLVQFYLLWPFLVLLLSRRSLTWLLAALVPFALVLRIVLASMGLSNMSIYHVTFCRIDAFAIGSLIAVLYRTKDGLQPFVVISKIVAIVCFFLILGLFVIGRDIQLVVMLSFSVFSLLFGSFLLLAVAGKEDNNIVQFLRWPFLRFFGKYSYGLYVFHLPISRFLRKNVALFKELPTVFGSYIPAQIMYIAFASAITLIVSVLSWNLYEKHFLKLKNCFV